MRRLTEKEFWNTVYLHENVRHRIPGLEEIHKPKWKQWLKQHLDSYWRDYSNYLEWDVLYDTYLPKTAGLKIIEIGSAPGTNLVRLHQRFGYEPYGVEYAETGANLNRTVFSQNGLNPNNVIRADAFSEDFLARYEGSFDLVISRGFIEHFTEMESVIAMHLRLLKPGGKLIVTIPKLTGVPNLLFRAFNPNVIPMHNLSIMNKKSFAALFQREGLRQEYCNYYGTFKINVCGVEHLTGVKATVMHYLLKVQLALNVLFRLLFGKQGADSAAFSPYLIFIGTKTH